MTLFEKSAILKHQNGGPHGLEYIDCCENNYWTKALGGRRKLFALKSCLKKCWDLPHVKEQAEEEYLFERSTFRLTGLKKSHREKLSHSKSEQNQSLDE
ncbi:hypothetical protein V9T40_007699 [Parthenolecanium corni]|uniref:Uncharacterized protein n=1 Tax=Parthenolecanium corni TaxID=536013 RepID=A0AAN9Y4X4_9HEMI